MVRRFFFAAAVLAVFGLLICTSADNGQAQSDVEQLLKAVNPEQSQPQQEELTKPQIEPEENINQPAMEQPPTQAAAPKTRGSADDQPSTEPGSDAAPAESGDSAGEAN
jgi:hypothetical protein